MKRLFLVVAFAAFALGSSSTLIAQLVSVEKQASYIQMSSSGAVSASTIGFPAYAFAVQTAQTSSQAGSFTPPGGSPTPVLFDSDSSEGKYFQTFSSLDTLNSTFPNGDYALGYDGAPTVTIPMGGDLYPAIPAITGGTWQNGALVVDFTKDITLNFTPFSGYASKSGGQVAGHMSLKITSLDGDNVNIHQEIITTSVGGGNATVTTTPLTSYKIPLGGVQPLSLYYVTLDYDVLTKADTTTIPGSAVAGVYENELNFYMVTQEFMTMIRAPSIVFQPSSVTAPPGGTASFVGSFTPSALTVGSGGTQTNGTWYFNGQPIQTSAKYKVSFSSPANAVSAEFLTVFNVTAADEGSYVLMASNGNGIAYTQPVTLTLGPAVVASITGQPPAAVTIPSASTATLLVGFTGAGPFTYQWFLNGNPIAGATASSYSITAATPAADGTYTLAITNSAGTATSNGEVLTVTPPPTPPPQPTPPPPPTPPVVLTPVFVHQPSTQLVALGTTAVFNVLAAGTPTPTYQWKFNAVEIPGATNSHLVITNASAANGGSYTCVATNNLGTALSSAAQMTLTPTTNIGRLLNLSVNTQAGKSQVLTVGFVTGGPGTTGSESLLIRATGPGLAALGVGGTLADPTLAIQNGATVVASNDNWGSSSANQSAVAAAEVTTFAFPLTDPTSLDSALVILLPVTPGYTVKVSGNTAASGTALAEVYDNTPASSFTLKSPRLINISANNQIAAGGSMTAGFVVGGTTSKAVLIRATGPALALLGVSGTIPDPQIALHSTFNSQDIIVATNSGWGGDPQIAAASNSVFAFPLTDPASKDSVVLMSLAPGSYTAVASSVSGAAGVVLIEVYEIP